MTPDNAREKWCPFAQDGTFNRRTTDGEARETCLCLADACMAWRWSWSPRQGARPQSRAEGKIEPYGYCGLAGAHGN